MKKIYETTHNTVVYAVDEPSENCNANHEFLILEEGNQKRTLQHIKMQNGAILPNGLNGIFMEHLIAICINMLNGFQTSKYKCRENAIAITKLEEALLWLNKRTNERIARGVEGTETV